MKKILFILLISYGAFNWYDNNDNNANYGHYGEPHTELIMYSLTTCGYCKQKVRELKKEQIAFTEYFIDIDDTKREELFTKLTQSGYKSRSIGTPTFDVHGTMLPNNPDMSVIKSILQTN